MNYSSSRVASVLRLLIVILMTEGVVLGQEQSSQARAQQLRVVIYQGELRSLLGSLADSYGVVIGFETDARLPALIKVEAHDVTFHQLLDVIVQGHPQYRWREVDGAIEFSPASHGNYVLDTVISNFEVKDLHFSAAIDSLLKLPEVQSSLAATALTRNEDGYQPRTPGNMFSLRLRQVTVRRALHEIARKSGTNFWAFRQFGDKSHGFFSLRTSL
jgi:hypothetical protein